MPLSQFVVDGIDALKQKLSSVGAKQTFIMFTGSKTNGKSWCPDCVTGMHCRQCLKRERESKRELVKRRDCFS